MELRASPATAELWTVAPQARPRYEAAEPPGTRAQYIGDPYSFFIFGVLYSLILLTMSLDDYVRIPIHHLVRIPIHHLVPHYHHHRVYIYVPMFCLTFPY